MVFLGVKHLVTLSPENRPASTNNCDITWHYIPTEEFEAPSLDDMRTFIEICEICKSKNEVRFEIYMLFSDLHFKSISD